MARIKWIKNDVSLERGNPNKYNPQVLLVSLVTRKRTYTRVIQTDKLGNEFAQYGTGYDMDRSFFLSLFR